MHQCPIASCKTRVPDHHLMCGKHWRLVPFDLNHDVYAAHAEYVTYAKVAIKSNVQADLSKADHARTKLKTLQREAIAAAETALAQRKRSTGVPPVISEGSA